MSIKSRADRDDLINRSVTNMKQELNGDAVTPQQEGIYRGLLEHMLDMEERLEQGQILSMFTPKQRKAIAGAVGTAMAVVGGWFAAGSPGS